ncbi:MAG: AMP-binding protein [Paludibacteraceae bacterium]
MNREYIILNGIEYDKNNIDLLASNSLSWQNEIYFFLRCWFDKKDSTTLRTSGSTGVPKKIDLAKELMRNSARATNDFFGLDTTKTALLCLPASYIAGKMMIIRAMMGGCNLISVEPSSNPFEHIQNAIDFTALTPYQLQHSLESLKKIEVKHIIVGGGEINLALAEKIDTLPSTVFETYGMTETASHIALRQLNGNSKSSYFETLQGIYVNQDKRNCLTIKAPRLFDGIMKTNDMVEIISDNKFRWLGRADNIINSGGIKILPEQIERKIAGCVSEKYFISSLPDDFLGQQVILVIESEKYPLPKETALKTNLKNLLQKYEIPKNIFFLPKFRYSSTYKILKKDTLREIESNLKSNSSYKPKSIV